ncbi:phosphoribosyltransferase family protein [Meiothermus taiwanensis]|jgi:adenine phosphoribosyltransferase|uniref:Xanthine phosphoribosyltransferase n=2 Tax=Meiothermus taiwanensis TaxID=172827 RepID=A0A399E4B3_9DEIN|nr:phosphoribosyltransferase family protein [Meiothermus taiwanensis]AWR87601.1 phosphoribosyltransferase [Meiothermus taiwanensis WR-220]KIQ53545.1 adenine phosphoribosyltransferase [Meiothermus taiwanensis]KZK16738.1 adenine phosphoribosyltransferase [Meiothermus taiwanensis]RIH79295.1 Xanthine phosphoribosyltransferase [Meiothermus taiwanensis]
METYPITIGKITRHVPVVETLPGVHIPLVEIMGDVELVQAAAEGLVKHLPPETDALLTLETSPIVLAHTMSAICGKPYVVVRRKRRPYMQDPIIQEVESLTLGVTETLWLDSRMAEKLMGQNVALVFDVVSSGGTMNALEKVAQKAGANVVARLAAFHQGNSKLPITFLSEIPILQTA